MSWWCFLGSTSSKEGFLNGPPCFFPLAIYTSFTLHCDCLSTVLTGGKFFPGLGLGHFSAWYIAGTPKMFECVTNKSINKWTDGQVNPEMLLLSVSVALGRRFNLWWLWLMIHELGNWGSTCRLGFDGRKESVELPKVKLPVNSRTAFVTVKSWWVPGSALRFTLSR